MNEFIIIILNILSKNFFVEIKVETSNILIRKTIYSPNLNKLLENSIREIKKLIAMALPFLNAES